MMVMIVKVMTVVVVLMMVMTAVVMLYCIWVLGPSSHGI